jgi:hypothetical protein
MGSNNTKEIKKPVEKQKETILRKETPKVESKFLSILIKVY